MTLIKKRTIQKVARWLIFVIVIGLIQIPTNKIFAQEVVGQGILITDWVNMGLNPSMLGGSAGTVYRGERFDLYEKVQKPDGEYCWHVRSHTLNVKGYVSEKFLKIEMNYQEDIEYDAELINVTDFYNMGLNANMTGGTAGTIYPGEKFKVISKEVSTVSYGYSYYVYAINAQLYGYVSPGYIKILVSATPTPSPIVLPTSTPTPSPIVLPTSIPTPSSIVLPTSTPTPSPIVLPTSTPIPSPTSEPLLPIKYGKTTEWVNLGINEYIIGGTSGRVEEEDIVEIYKEVLVDNVLRYYVYAQNAKIYGWVSARYVKIIDEPNINNVYYTYENKSDLYHEVTEITKTINGSVEKYTYTEIHSYSGVIKGNCTKCGKEYVYPSGGEYITKVKYALRTEPSSSSDTPYVYDENNKKVIIPKGKEITIFEVEMNESNNFWGKVNWNGYIGYIWMGRVKLPYIDRIIDVAYQELREWEKEYTEKGKVTRYLSSGSNQKKSKYSLIASQPQPWCVDFITWCAGQAGIPTHIIPDQGIKLGQYSMSSCSQIKEYMTTYLGAEYHALGTGYVPQPGDIVYYNYGGGHMGLVVKVDTTTKQFYTIEGNTTFQTEDGRHDNSDEAGCVGFKGSYYKRYYAGAYTTKEILGFLTPNY